MASSTDTRIQVLLQSYKEILIQAGKHFRVIAKDGPGALVGTHSGIQAKAGDSLSQYNLALNDIEAEIIQARSVLLRDLENLRAARAPAPVPAPIPAPQPVAPPAPMMELPSAAAHSRSLNAAPVPAAVAIPMPSSGKEIKTVAPFPDMGMGMSADVVDLTVGDKKPSPRVQPGSVKAAARSIPTASVKPSPKPVHKPMPPAKVTPVPPPQIPRLQSFQASSAAAQAKSQPVPPPSKVPQPSQPPQQVPAAKTAQDSAMDSISGLPSAGVNDGSVAATGNNELNFTHMEFSLAPAQGESHGAPPAPMPEFDLATFAPPGGNINTATDSTLNNNPQTINTSSNVDDLFNLGDTNVNLGDTNGDVDNMFDLGSADVNDSTFDDMMFFGENDAGMGQFDDAYFGL